MSRSSRSGQSLVEYSLILALMVLVAAPVLTRFGAQTGQEMGNVTAAVGNAIADPVDPVRPATPAPP